MKYNMDREILSSKEMFESNIRKVEEDIDEIVNSFELLYSDDNIKQLMFWNSTNSQISIFQKYEIKNTLMLYYFDDEQYMSIDLNAPSEDAEENTETDSKTSENKNTEENVEEKLSFEIIAGEAGEYGKKLIFNKGTEFEQERWYYSIPIGTYKITNIGDYMAPLMIYVDEININEDGWEEPVIAQEGQMLKIDQETTVTLEEGQVVYIQEPAIFSFEMQ